MSLNLKNPHVVKLASEVAKMAGETKTEAVRRALEDRRARLVLTRRVTTPLRDFLEREVWPSIPSELLGPAPEQGPEGTVIAVEWQDS